MGMMCIYTHITHGYTWSCMTMYYRQRNASAAIIKDMYKTQNQ